MVPKTGEGGKVEMITLTFREAFRSILGPRREEVRTAEDLAKAHQLSERLYTSSEINLTDDDRVYLRKRLPATFNSQLVNGRIIELFDAKKKEEGK